MTYGEIEESAGNFSLYFSSSTYFILLLTRDGGLDGVLFVDA